MKPQEVPQAEPPPIPPAEPRSDECCRTGCDPCIYDLYFDELARYEEARAAWDARHPGASAGGQDA